MNENKIWKFGFMLMIMNGDGSFSPVSSKDESVIDLFDEFLTYASQNKLIICDNEKYVRKEAGNGVDSGR